MARHDIIVIGASAGGVNALMDLVQTLPKDFSGSIFIVLHLAPFSKSLLPEILSRNGHLKAVHPQDGQSIESGMIYIAPPDHHLLVEKDRILVKRGPKENRFRPSIDALFRSAAYQYGPRVIGIVLSGLLDDGTSGMWTIKRFGGICIIQDAAEAMHASMPESVGRFVDVDYELPVKEIGPLLHQLCTAKAPKKPKVPMDENKRIKKEIAIAAEKNAFEAGILEEGTPALLTCPECNGALVSIKEGKLKRYRCHTGHAFGAEALLAGVTKSIEEDFWRVIKGMEESVMLLNDMSNNLNALGQKDAAAEALRRSKEIQKRTEALRKNIFSQDQTIVDLEPNGNGKAKSKVSRKASK